MPEPLSSVEVAYGQGGTWTSHDKAHSVVVDGDTGSLTVRVFRDPTDEEKSARMDKDRHLPVTMRDDPDEPVCVAAYGWAPRLWNTWTQTESATVSDG